MFRLSDKLKARPKLNVQYLVEIAKTLMIIIKKIAELEWNKLLFQDEWNDICRKSQLFVIIIWIVYVSIIAASACKKDDNNSTNNIEIIYNNSNSRIITKSKLTATPEAAAETTKTTTITATKYNTWKGKMTTKTEWAFKLSKIGQIVFVDVASHLTSDLIAFFFLTKV